MGGDDSQKLLPWRGTYSLRGAANLRLTTVSTGHARADPLAERQSLVALSSTILYLGVPPEPPWNRCSAFSRSQIRFAVCRCFFGCDLSSSRIWSMIPTHGPSFGRFTGFFRSYPGGTEYASIFRIVFRANPNARHACRILIPFT